MSEPPVVATLYSAAGCHLCLEMRAQLDALAEELPLRLEVIDIAGDAELEARYRQELPVLLLNGRKAAKHRISDAALRDRVERALGRRRPWWRLR